MNGGPGEGSEALKRDHVNVSMPSDSDDGMYARSSSDLVYYVRARR